MLKKTRDVIFKKNFYFYLLIVIAFLIRLYFSWIKIPYFNKIIGDDAFYYFTIARNIAAGNGITFDGLSPTNGFHPLYVVLLLPFFLFNFNDVDVPVHLGLTTLSILNVMTAIVLYKIIIMFGRKKAALYSTFIWLFNPYIIFLTLSGVEASLNAFFLSVVIYHYIKMKFNCSYSLPYMFTLGIFMGISFLCRTDNIFLFICVFIDLIYTFDRKQMNRALMNIYRILSYSLGALLVVSPWLIWNILTFNEILQTSGQSLSFFVHSSFLNKYGSFFSLQFLMKLAWNFYYMADRTAEFVLSDRLITTFIAGIIVSQVIFKTNHKSLRKIIKETWFLGLFSVFIFCFYSGYQWFIQNWYFMSLVFISTIFVGFGIEQITQQFYEILKSSQSIRGLQYNKIQTSILLLIFLIFSIKGAYIWNKGMYQPGEGYEMVMWMNENIPDTDRIAAFDSGLLGYYSDNTLINLDGVVNNDAAKAMREGQLYSYIKEMNVTYVILDTPSLKAKWEKYQICLGDGYELFLSDLKEVHRIGNSVLYQLI